MVRAVQVLEIREFLQFNNYLCIIQARNVVYADAVLFLYPAVGTVQPECRIEEQYSICIYNIPGLNNTQVIVELKKFTNFEDLNGTYHYNSLHMFSSQGLISQNTLGDQSRFRVNNENDYGGNLTPPGVYYYHLWITKSLHLIHVTSSGSNKDAGEHVTRAGQMTLSKLEFKLA